VNNQRAVRGITQPIRFQGQWHDEESGLCYNRHGYYDPRTGNAEMPSIISLIFVKH